MLLLNGSYQPWFIKEVDWRGFDEGLILFEEVTTPEKARNYSRHELFLTEKEVNTYFKKDSNSVDFMVGFLAIDEHEGEIGPITAVTENPGQLLLSIDRQGTEVMIPLVDDFIVKLDKRKKQVIFNLPAGLLNL
jgi:16S rRNA processing protein RimM